MQSFTEQNTFAHTKKTVYSIFLKIYQVRIMLILPVKITRTEKKINNNNQTPTTFQNKTIEFRLYFMYYRMHDVQSICYLYGVFFLYL